ncbi:HAMP domain-containing histidine kinase [Patescibacteria group bacterium]|nr:HAMP domain-containing histidine kinase [Patescibacteria group bacterium]MBU1500872.1 HAMP domain-containing histidine kinase [Patescibacteria group bacterium]MBU2080927.1 HAMP domain-containing histidine kinase [Patescibacteria group bacterium]MBU2124032.1 HAMP domain-containing histidine kinase [Patescibacteria group bacterium]MBU2194677.1 HAMP domain-containing histidine kinase [Patescibacteria group bacterium]
MTIRLFMAALLSGVFVLTIGVISVIGMFLRVHLTPLVTNLETSASLQTAVLQISVLSLLVSILLLLFVFWAVGKYIADPVRKITNTMEAFSASGTLAELPDSKGMPKEIKNFSREFGSFAQRVEEAHRHDVEVSRVKSDFISTAAHQLRTPLTGIRWALEALELEPLTEEQKALVASAREKSHQLVAVVGTLLDISSIESGKYKYDLKPTDLNALVDEVTQDFSELSVKEGVNLLFEKSGEVLPSVRIDRERTRWILNNLVENAIRYTPRGGNVRVTTEVAPGRVYVRIRDTGIGIAPEDKGNIFERFYRAPNAVTKQNGGNGLGLYIARTIATDQGGDLSFSANDAGPGTTFTLSLPFG